MVTAVSTAMIFENVAHRLVGHFMAKIRQDALNLVVTPRRNVSCKTQNQVDNLFGYARPAHSFTLVGVIPLLGNQSPMPT